MRMLARVEGMPLESLRDGRAVGLVDVHRRVPRRARRASSASTPGSWSVTRRSGASSWAARPPTAPPPTTSSPRCRACSTRASRPAVSASPRRGRAPTTTPRATWCRRATHRATSSSRCARVAGRARGHLARVHPDGRAVRAVGRRADGRHVGRRPAPAQLERPHRERGNGRRRAGPSWRPATWPGRAAARWSRSRSRTSFRRPALASPRASCSTPCRAGRRRCCCPATRSSRSSGTRPPATELNAAAQAPGNPMGRPRQLVHEDASTTSSPRRTEQYEGRMVGEIAAEQGRDPFDMLCRHRASPTSC